MNAMLESVSTSLEGCLGALEWVVSWRQSSAWQNTIWDTTTVQRALQARHFFVLPSIVLLMFLCMFELVGACCYDLLACLHDCA